MLCLQVALYIIFNKDVANAGDAVFSGDDRLHDHCRLSLCGGKST